MKYNVIARNIELTKGLEHAVMDKVVKLDKYFGETAQAQVTLSVEKQRHIIEITIPFNGQILRAEVESDNMYAIIDDAVDIIEKQVTRFKNKLRTRNRSNPIPALNPFFINHVADDEEDVSLRVDKKKNFAIKPMDTEEAVMQMELLGHNFFVYLDAHSEEVNVVYKRKNGTYGLIEPSFN
ncbi:MAG: ribosome hibernation-promoting factor, HPF/YfiA family [Cellulosilyticaceae bacterium]